jgi:hypothetical protein
MERRSELCAEVCSLWVVGSPLFDVIVFWRREEGDELKVLRF